MEEQVPPSQPGMQYPPQMEGQITPEQLAELKARAREAALRQAFATQPTVPGPGAQTPQIVYVRRNLTVAEVLLVLLLSCGIVTGIQMTWNGISNFLPKIEVRVK
jgi:hypothetical protein